MASVTRETSLWKWLEGSRRFFGDNLVLFRMENLLDRGSPDVFGCFLAKAFWIELKCAPRPKRGGRLSLRHVTDKQVEWAAHYDTAQGHSSFLIQVGSGHNLARYLLPGKLGPMLRYVTEEALNSHSLLASPAPKVNEVIWKACDANYL